MPTLDVSSAETRAGQEATIASVLKVLKQRAQTLAEAARGVETMPAPEETSYPPDFGDRRGNPLCRQFRAILGRGPRDRPPASGAGADPHGYPRCDPGEPRPGGTKRRVEQDASIGVHQHYFGQNSVQPAFMAVEDIQRGQGFVMNIWSRWASTRA